MNYSDGICPILCWAYRQPGFGVMAFWFCAATPHKSLPCRVGKLSPQHCAVESDMLYRHGAPSDRRSDACMRPAPARGGNGPWPASGLDRGELNPVIRHPKLKILFLSFKTNCVPFPPELEVFVHVVRDMMTLLSLICYNNFLNRCQKMANVTEGVTRYVLLTPIYLSRCFSVPASQSGDVKGSLAIGVGARAYVPNCFVEAQHEAAHAFFSANGYLDHATASELQVCPIINCVMRRCQVRCVRRLILAPEHARGCSRL